MLKKIKRALRKRFFLKKAQKPDALIEQFRTSLLAQLQENIAGIYLIGSYSLNDLQTSLSDIDFIVALIQDLSVEDLKRLEKIHLEIEQEVLQPNLNGIYIKQEHLGKSAAEIDRLTYFHEGELKTAYHQSTYYEINPISWTELSTSGVPIYGQIPSDSRLNPSWEAVDKYMYENINSYWKKWLVESKNPWHSYYYQTLFKSSDNAWCVSGVARQLYTLLEQDICSKRQACEYFLDKAPVKYLPILKDAIYFRQGKASRISWRQKRDTLAFLAYCISEFNLNYHSKYKI